MRLTEVVVAGQRPVRLALHPRVSVVQGAPGAELRDALVAAARGRPEPGTTGLIEAHGVLLDLDAQLLDPLEIPPTLPVLIASDELAATAGGPMSQDSDERAELRFQRSEVLAALEALPRHDPAGVADALAALRDAPVGAPDAEEIDYIVAAWRIGRDAEATHRARVVEARQALEAAEAAYHEAAEGSEGQPLQVEPAALAELEAVHEAAAEAERRVDSAWLPGPFLRRRLSRARRAEKAVLHRLGLESYGAYLLRSSPMHADPRRAERLAGLDRARRDAAQRVLDLDAHSDDSTELLKETLGRVRELLADAGVAEGDELAADDVAAAIAALRVRANAASEARSRLEEALAAAGVTPSGGLEAAAESWLREVADAEARRTALRGRLEVVDAALAAASTADGSESADRGRVLEDLEVYVWARVAGVRVAGCVGSAPVVADDPFAVLSAEEATTVAETLARGASAVQVIITAESSELVDWARSQPPHHVGIVRPEDMGPAAAEEQVT